MNNKPYGARHRYPKREAKQMVRRVHQGILGDPPMEPEPRKGKAPPAIRASGNTEVDAALQAWYGARLRLDASAPRDDRKKLTRDVAREAAEVLRLLEAGGKDTSDLQEFVTPRTLILRLEIDMTLSRHYDMQVPAETAPADVPITLDESPTKKRRKTR